MRSRVGHLSLLILAVVNCVCLGVGRDANSAACGARP